MNKKYYLKATGSTCYDQTGITFPHKISYDLRNMVWGRGALHIRWGRQFGWSNQPHVLSFRAEEIEAKLIQSALNNQALKLIVCEKSW